ncbi:voltage-gated chloride channel protein [Enterococcus plantarum]|uniref:Voltage-gated chloride channel protein n=1 Tax=Enterococcus plantarum TaxID=1077675 RepID=A0A2W3Z6Q6_9ENTE|nr:voltage-gated chloride channel family protein [Enterococcus plantarum]MBO0421990.1 voltage-gated chloride channel family protein [Enterococcus plantarum]MBO0466814.1 voltage-gated chloride channel family protein [Enterococcus plantarum]OEG13184.1 voltage-gated chloride channel protein [Enterococcus plantarum]PZL75396.1 voltage-gated chloride channel protein [Enterococcus plantarum]
MKKELNMPLKVSIYMVKWLMIASLIGLVMGTLSAFFLKSLDIVTQIRVDNSWLLFLLPVSGAIFAFLYKKFGGNSIRGNNLVIDQANGEQENIPLRLIPLTLFGTITTHLFGGSVGREGTAVQMGGTVADTIGRLFKLNKIEREIVIISGISAGFSSVFGTPLAGTLFGLEVLVIGRLRSDGLFPSFFAAIFANFVTESLGITHTHYAMGPIPEWSLLIFTKIIVAGICFGLVGWLFSRSIVWVKTIYTKWFANVVLRNFIGGIIVVVAVFIFKTQRYLGLSLPLLKDAFYGENHWFDFIGKLFFTVLSLGAGYQGGEVTPLFEIGATLGSSLALILHLSIPFLAGLGFIGVFSGATNTPIACFIMGIELFGSEAALYFFMICLISYMCSGNAGIYSAQRVEVEKGVLFLPIWTNWRNKKRNE